MIALVLLSDRGEGLRATTIAEAEQSGLLDRVEPDLRALSWHAVSADGTVWSAGVALAQLLHRTPALRPLAWAMRQAPSLADSAYGAVASRRGIIGRRIPSEVVERADAVIAARRSAHS